MTTKDETHETDHLDPPILPPDDPIEDAAGGEDAEAELEAKARKQGWRPESEWDEKRAQREGRRKPARFLTAQEFLDRAEDELPVVRANQKRLESEIEGLKSQTKEQAQFIKDMRKHHLESLDRVRAEERQKIKDEANRAASEGDMVAHDAAMKKLDQLDETQRKQIVEEARKAGATEAAPPAQPAADPEIDAWVRQNSWFTAPGKEYLNALMIAEHKNVQAMRPELSKSAQLDAAKRKVMARFPEDFGIAPSPTRGSAVEPPNNRRGGDSAEAKFARLPAEDRAAYVKHKAKFEAMGLKYTIQEFLTEGGY
jgi:hypothetical protein